MSNINVNKDTNIMSIHVSEMPYMPMNKGENFAYVMLMKNGEIVSEPFIPVHYDKDAFKVDPAGETVVYPDANTAVTADPNGGFWIAVASTDFNNNTMFDNEVEDDHKYEAKVVFGDAEFDSVMVDYYVERIGNAQQIEITADKFGGNYYLEASTLFRDQNGVDMPAEFIIPNCKVQSNFTFTMASSGDPSSFTFTMDAFPDYTRFDKSKKVLAAIQMIKEAGSQDLHRHSTAHEDAHNLLF
jgi:hypothetical protein